MKVKKMFLNILVRTMFCFKGKFFIETLIFQTISGSNNTAVATKYLTKNLN